MINQTDGLTPYIRSCRPRPRPNSAFVLETCAYIGETFDAPGENRTVVFSECPGESMTGVDRVGGEWSGE